MSSSSSNRRPPNNNNNHQQRMSSALSTPRDDNNNKQHRRHSFSSHHRPQPNHRPQQHRHLNKNDNRQFHPYRRHHNNNNNNNSQSRRHSFETPGQPLREHQPRAPLRIGNPSFSPLAARPPPQRQLSLEASVARNVQNNNQNNNNHNPLSDGPRSGHNNNNNNTWKRKRPPDNPRSSLLNRPQSWRHSNDRRDNNNNNKNHHNNNNNNNNNSHDRPDSTFAKQDFWSRRSPDPSNNQETKPDQAAVNPPPQDDDDMWSRRTLDTNEALPNNNNNNQSGQAEEKVDFWGRRTVRQKDAAPKNNQDMQEENLQNNNKSRTSPSPPQQPNNGDGSSRKAEWDSHARNSGETKKDNNNHLGREPPQHEPPPPLNDVESKVPKNTVKQEGKRYRPDYYDDNRKSQSSQLPEPGRFPVQAGDNSRNNPRPTWEKHGRQPPQHDGPHHRPTKNSNHNSQSKQQQLGADGDTNPLPPRLSSWGTLHNPGLKPPPQQQQQQDRKHVHAGATGGSRSRNAWGKHPGLSQQPARAPLTEPLPEAQRTPRTKNSDHRRRGPWPRSEKGNHERGFTRGGVNNNHTDCHARSPPESPRGGVDNNHQDSRMTKNDPQRYSEGPATKRSRVEHSESIVSTPTATNPKHEEALVDQPTTTDQPTESSTKPRDESDVAAATAATAQHVAPYERSGKSLGAAVSTAHQPEHNQRRNVTSVAPIPVKQEQQVVSTTIAPVKQENDNLPPHENNRQGQRWGRPEKVSLLNQSLEVPQKVVSGEVPANELGDQSLVSPLSVTVPDAAAEEKQPLVMKHRKRSKKAAKSTDDKFVSAGKAGPIAWESTTTKTQANPCKKTDDTKADDNASESLEKIQGDADSHVLNNEIEEVENDIVPEVVLQSRNTSKVYDGEIETCKFIVDGNGVPLVGPNSTDPDCQFLTHIQWGPRPDEDGYDTDQELVPKPRRKRAVEDCGCTTGNCRDEKLCINYACFEECGSSCSNLNCDNQRLQFGKFKKVRVFDAGPNKGFGLKLLEPVVKGDLIQEYVGQAIHARALPKLFRRYKHQRKLYIMSLDDKTYLDAYVAGGLARYMNHSCRPNAKVERWKVRGGLRAAVIALKDITPGTELCFDYQWQPQPGRAATKCYCMAPTCRGTLEVFSEAKHKIVKVDSLNKDEVLGDPGWVTLNWIPYNLEPDQRLVNRTIRILPSKEARRALERSARRSPKKEKKPNENPFEDTDEENESDSDTDTEVQEVPTVIAEVTGYDEKRKQHKLLYRETMAEEWHDLSSLEWLVLDEGAMDNVIGRKISSSHEREDHVPNNKKDKNSKTLLQSFPPVSTVLQTENVNANGQQILQPQHFLFLQTPIKEAFWGNAKNVRERVERNCRVQFTVQQMARPPLPCNPDDPEDVAKFKALDESHDGSVWKLSWKGDKVPEAFEFLTKSIPVLQRKLEHDQAVAAMGGHHSPVPSFIHIAASNPDPGAVNVAIRDEIIFPRVIADQVKRKIGGIRERVSRNHAVSLQFAASESKSKGIARLMLEGKLASDMQTAKAYIWNFLWNQCEEAGVPKKPIQHKSSGRFLPADLGLLGGTLSREQLALLKKSSKLLQSAKRQMQSKPSGAMSLYLSNHASALHTPQPKLQDISYISSPSSNAASEDLNQSPFFTSFESTFGCTIWIQSEDDMGRIDSSHRLVGEASSTTARKIYLGCCDPRDVVTRWANILVRAQEVARGVTYLYLGVDRIYQKEMMKNNASFFEFVRCCTGASVQIDPMTGDHLRIDGSVSMDIDQTFFDSLPARVRAMADHERVQLAEEIIQLQIETYRDHFIRQQTVIFGRDWESCPISVGQRGGSVKSAAPEASKYAGIISSALGRLDVKSALNSSADIVEIVETLRMPPIVAAHTAIILYRFVAVAKDTQLKSRDAVLACVFIACKAQRARRWKRLEAILEAGYKTFYRGTKFNAAKEEARNLEDKIITAEQEILSSLEYDIFIPGADAIKFAVSLAGKNKKAFTDDVFKFACSSQVLGAGPELWLKYGLEYVFALSVGFLEGNVVLLMDVLQLNALKLTRAVEVLMENIKAGRHQDIRTASHEMLEASKEQLEFHAEQIKATCVNLLMKKLNPDESDEGPEANDVLFLSVAKAAKRRYHIPGVPRSVVIKYLLDKVDKIEADSGSRIFFVESSDPDAEDIVIEGHWRAIAFADHLLRAEYPDGSLPRTTDVSKQTSGVESCSAKVRAGLVDAAELRISGGWEDAMHALAPQSACSSDLHLRMTTSGRLSGKAWTAGRVAAAALHRGGFRWWIRGRQGAAPSGSLSDMLLLRCGREEPLKCLASLTETMGEEGCYKTLQSFRNETSKDVKEDPCIALTLQRWPTEKASLKEARSTKTNQNAMRMGFSAAALQELALLVKLHKSIPSPYGHPNFVLPIGVAVPSENDVDESPTDVGIDLYSLARSSEENEKAANREKRVKSFPHLLFQPTPFLLQRFLCKPGEDTDTKIWLTESPAVVTSWMHDLISAVAHCHANNIMLRTLQGDQILVDHNGVLKLCGFYRSVSVDSNDSPEPANHTALVALAKDSRKRDKDAKRRDDESADANIHGFSAPEILLGVPNFSRATDVWMLGCFIAQLLMLGKPLISGRNRRDLLVSVYRVVGTPSKGNFEVAVNLPHYFKPQRGYSRSPRKCLEHMIKDPENIKHFDDVLTMISGLLHLDPFHRCSAWKALQHQCFSILRPGADGHDEMSRRFVKQWLELRNKAIRRRPAYHRQEKRKALLMATRVENDTDDLYDIEDLLEEDTTMPKRQKMRDEDEP